MKIGINKIYLLFLFSVALIACEKDEDRVILQPGTSPELSASTNTLVLDREQADDEAITFSWTPADFGFQAAVNYTLQLAEAGTNFADPINVELENQLERAYTVDELNSRVMQLGIEPETEGQVEARVRATLAESVEPVFSNTVTVDVTPYSSEVELPSIYVPGAYQGWDPGTAAALTSAEDDGIYSGYVTFPDAESLEFKFTVERNWDENYGAEGDGPLEQDGPNLTVPEPGTYLIEVDLNEMSWSATPYAWGIVGDATAGGWETDTEMNYDHTEGIWTLTADLEAGNMKFRLNNDWANNYGDDDLDSETLNEGGADIPITEAGTYDITLDLRDEENPTYSLELQE